MSLTDPTDNVIVCEGLTKSYEDFTALDGLNLNITRGSVFGYIGHNGAGKTTTIRILAGLLKASSGKASICGVDVASGGDKIKSLIGYMPDAFGVYDQMRVWEYLDFFGAAYKIPRKERKKRVDHVLEISEGEYMRDRFVDTLSKGMKQRVGIARTLMHDPEVLLLDEPASGLDPRARVQMRTLIRRLADNGKTVLVSSHILPELAAICDTIAILHQGKLRAFGELQTVLDGLQRDRMMEVKCLGNAEAAQKILEDNEHCSKVEQAELLSHTLRFRFSGDDEGLAALLTILNEADAKVATFREVPLSLEDAYMAISDISGDEEDEETEAEELAGPAKTEQDEKEQREEDAEQAEETEEEA